MTSTLKINTIEPEGATTTLTVGESGQDTVIAGAGIKANVLKDAGANAIFTSDGSGNISGLNSAFGSAQVLISTQTADDSASLSFTSGIDSTYKKYIFEFFDINPATDNAVFQFQAGSSYDTTMTTTAFTAYNSETGGTPAITYWAAQDQAQGTAFQPLGPECGNGADECSAGELHLYNPASATYIKNYYSRVQQYQYTNMSQEFYSSGYFNITTALTQVQFKFSSGNINEGTIKMYGIK